MDAGDLQAGDILLLRDGRQVEIEDIRIAPARQPVYNFSVAELSCYAVGPMQVLVHNNCKPEGASAPINKNSRAYQVESHVYVVKAPDGSVYKVGKSSAGKRIADESTKRAESQVRKLNRKDIAEGGLGGYTSNIRKDRLPSSGSTMGL